MDNSEINVIKSCASILQSSDEEQELLNTLRRLQTNVSMTIDVLRTTRIGAIVNKLAKKSTCDAVHTLALRLVSEWKKIAISSSPQQLQKTPPRQAHQTSSKRSLSQVESLSQVKNAPQPKRARMETAPSTPQRPSPHAGYFIGSSSKKGVPSLQQMCIKYMKQNAIKLGRIDVQLNGELIQQIYGSLKPPELKQILRINPHFREHLDVLWRRQLIQLNPNYVKKDDSMSWFRAYQLYLLDKKDKLESAKINLSIKTRQAQNEKQKATIFNKEEAAIFKQAVNNKLNKNRNRTPCPLQQKRNRAMKECREFVQARNRMFKTVQTANFRKEAAAHNRKQAFVKRQKDMREKRKADRNRVCPW